MGLKDPQHQYYLLILIISLIPGRENKQENVSCLQHHCANYYRVFYLRQTVTHLALLLDIIY